MNLNEYQLKAMTTRLATAGDMYALLNLAGEVGELLSLEAKLLRDGAKVDDYKKNAIKELGDVLWHVAAIAADLGVTLEEVATVNLEKLKGRMARNTINGNGDDR